MHAVIALELGIVRQRVDGGTAVLGVVQIKVVRLVEQREKEEIRVCSAGRSLTRAAHVGLVGSRVKALGPIVPAAGLRGVNQSEGLATIRRCPLLVKVNGDMRNLRLPTQLQEQRWVVKWTSRSIHNMSIDAAVLAGREGHLAEFDERVLSGKSLPALGENPRGVNSAR